MNDNITQSALIALLQRVEKTWMEENNSLPLKSSEEGWNSVCKIEDLGDDIDPILSWKAVKRDDGATLKNIEEALEITLHPSISDFFCYGYADTLLCSFDGHPIELLQIWNEDDFKMLQENMIAHFMMQKRLGQPASMFIASCSDEMQIISIDNETGQVQLENLGKGQEAVLAETLAEFLNGLTPMIDYSLTMV